MKALTTFALALAVALLVGAAVAPSLIALSNALMPFVLGGGVVVLVLRLVFFHTRRW